MSLQRTQHVFLNYIHTGAAGSLQVLGLARSVLAAGLLLTLLFNSSDTLFPGYHLQKISANAMRFRLNFFLLLGPQYVPYLKVVGVLGLLWVISGFYWQVTAFLHCWIAASFYVLRPDNVGGDNIIVMLTLLLIPVCLYDKRNNHWQEPVTTPQGDAYIQTAVLWLIKLQVAYIYFDACFKKLLKKEWLDGTVLYYWFTHNFYGLHPSLVHQFNPMLHSKGFTVGLTWGTLVFEAILAVGFLFSNQVKGILLKSGIIFHFAILLVHGFTSFFFAMSGALLLYLYPQHPAGQALFPLRKYKWFYAGFVLLLAAVNTLLPVPGYYFLYWSIGTIGIVYLLYPKRRSSKTFSSL